jgi:hypothetical protein
MEPPMALLVQELVATRSRFPWRSTAIACLYTLLFKPQSAAYYFTSSLLVAVDSSTSRLASTVRDSSNSSAGTEAATGTATSLLFVAL